MRRCLLVLSLGAVATVAISSAAAAAPSSAVSTPAATVVYTYDYDNPGNPANQIALAGTASTTPVDVVCSSISQPSGVSFAAPWYGFDKHETQ